MALRDKSSFVGRNLQTPSIAPAIQALQNVGSLISDEEKLIADERLRQDSLAQRAIENARASERLNLAQAQDVRQEIVSKRDQAIYDASLAQEKELARIIGSVPSKISGSKTIPGVVTPSNQALIDERNAFNAAIRENQAVLDIDRDVSGVQYDAAYNEFLSRSKDQPNLLAPTRQVSYGEGSYIPASSAKLGQLRTAEGKEVGFFDKLFGDYKEVKDFSYADPAATVSPTAPKVGATVESTGLDLFSEANKFAMKESGMDKVVERFNKIVDKKDVPALVEATESVSRQIPFNRDMTKSEQKEALRVAIKNSTLSGSGMTKALESVDKMFAKDKKGLTFDQMFKTKKYQADKAEENRILKDYKDTYEKMPDSISTLKGAEAWITKVNKSFKQSGSSFLEDMYINLTGKDDDDVEAVDEFYIRNKVDIDRMSKSGQKALGEKLKVLYNQQSSFLDVMDYVPGYGPARTTLQDLVIK